MGINLKATATNNADWNMQIEVKDADTGALVDFTGAVVEIEIKDANNCRKLCGSIDNGRVTLPSTGVIEWLFLASDMKCLCVGAYKMGGVYELGGATVSLFTGELTVIDGVARL
jgi:hypothetical protein